MRILVTGGAGFIGSNFIRYWLARHSQDEVINFDVLTYAGNLENLTEIANDPRYRFVKGDICDKTAVTAAMEGVDVVVHFAAESHVDRSILGPEAFVKTNVEGTFVLLEAARRQNTRFHHVSTDEVFGSLELGTVMQFDESTPYDPSSPYSASKAGSDHLVRAYHRTFNLPVTISNTSNNFGPYMFPEKLIPLAITRLMENKPVPIYGAGNQVRDWLYVLDHCRAIELILEKGVLGETYLIGGMSEEVSNLEVVKKIMKIMGKHEELIEFVNDRPGHDVRYSVNWTKAKTTLGYQPEHDFETYLTQTVTWYQEHEPWWRRVISGEYQDYYKTQYGQA